MRLQNSGNRDSCFSFHWLYGVSQPARKDISSSSKSKSISFHRLLPLQTLRELPAAGATFGFFQVRVHCHRPNLPLRKVAEKNAYQCPSVSAPLLSPSASALEAKGTICSANSKGSSSRSSAFADTGRTPISSSFSITQSLR